MTIVFSKEVENYLFNLMEVLYNKEYFSYYETSNKYVSKLIKEIKTTIHLKQKHNTPFNLKKHGLYYKKFSINKGTSWVVFYNYSKGTYYINYISNNHAPDAEFLEGSK